MSRFKDILKEVRKVNRDFDNLYNGTAYIEIEDESNAGNLTLVLTPRDGDFEGARIPFSLTFTEDESQAPSVRCQVPIFHCNVSFDGSVCFNMLGGDAYHQTYTVESFVNGLLWLLDNPNPDSALNSTCSVRDPEERRLAVQKSMRGLHPNTPTPYIADPSSTEPIEVPWRTWLDTLKGEWSDTATPYLKPTTDSSEHWFNLVLENEWVFRLHEPSSLDTTPLFVRRYPTSGKQRDIAVLTLNTEFDSPENVAFAGERKLASAPPSAQPIYGGNAILPSCSNCDILVDKSVIGAHFSLPISLDGCLKLLEFHNSLPSPEVLLHLISLDTQIHRLRIVDLTIQPPKAPTPLDKIANTFKRILAF